MCIHYTHRYTHKAIVKVQIEFKWYNLIKNNSLQLTRVEAGDGPLGGPELLLPQNLASYLRCTGAELRSEHAGLVCCDSTVYRTLSPVSQAPPAQARRISMGTVPEAKAHPLAEGSHGLLTTTGRATERAKTRSGIRNSGKFLLQGSLVNGSMKNI